MTHQDWAQHYASQDLSEIDKFRCEYGQLEVQCRMGQPATQLPPFEEWLIDRTITAERERCAKIAEEAPCEPYEGADPDQIAGKIRSGADWTAEELKGSCNPKSAAKVRAEE